MSESSNAVLLRLPLEILMLIREESSKNEQLSATAILRILTEHFKEKLIEKHGEPLYTELRNRYSMTAHEQKEIKNLKEQTKQFKKQSKIDNLKQQYEFWKAQLAKHLGNVKYNKASQNDADNAQRHLTEIKQKLAELGEVVA